MIMFDNDSEQLEFLNSQPYYASKKIVIQSSDFPVRRTGSYRQKKHCTWHIMGHFGDETSRHFVALVNFQQPREKLTTREQTWPR